MTQPERAHAKLVAVERSVRDDPSLPRTDRDALEAIRRAASEHKRGGDLHAALEELTRQALYLALRHEGGEMVIAEAICTQGEVTTSWLQRDLEVLASPRGDCGGWR